jgi:hypothetical protein
MKPASVSAGLEGVDAVVSELGIRNGDPPGTLTAGARALAAARPPRMVWLGALGAGASTGKVGLVYGLIMRIVAARSSLTNAKPMRRGGGRNDARASRPVDRETAEPHTHDSAAVGIQAAPPHARARLARHRRGGDARRTRTRAQRQRGRRPAALKGRRSSRRRPQPPEAQPHAERSAGWCQPRKPPPRG